jgi:hypothetical protein
MELWTQLQLGKKLGVLAVWGGGKAERVATATATASATATATAKGGRRG